MPSLRFEFIVALPSPYTWSLAVDAGSAKREHVNCEIDRAVISVTAG
jgi:hypothetical protein